MQTESRALRASIILLACLGALTALYITQDVAAPMTLGVITGIVLSPVMDGVRRLGVPAGTAATLILLVTIAAIGALIFAIEPLIWRIMDEIPNIRRELRSIIYDFQGLIQGIDDVNEEMKEALGGAEATAQGDGGDTKEALDELPSVTDALFLAPVIMAQMLVFAGTFYFFLLTRNELYAALARRIGGIADTSRISKRFRTAEYLVSRYFFAISVVNAGLGAALGTYLSLIGLPLPLVWGFAAFLLNYVLYVGPAMVAIGLLLSGLIHFNGVMAIAPMAGFLLLNMTEAQFVTPAMVGRHVSLNPLVVFLSLVFGIWFWGPIGGIVAIPVIVIVVALLDDVATERMRREQEEAASS
ncbi:AI-2E family transporter [Thalassococcus sp. BH17M4-6]|uniref:AI-2E family transporter n=1 Tax=Thalassococcus sp. BH17M4-6 TaxID=3413148 RepID=UPI003BCDF551